MPNCRRNLWNYMKFLKNIKNLGLILGEKKICGKISYKNIVCSRSFEI